MGRSGGAQGGVDGVARAVLGVGPQVGVGVEGFRGCGVTESCLHGLDGLAVADEQRGEVVAQVVESGAAACAGRGDDGALYLAGESGAVEHVALVVGEQEAVGVGGGVAVEVLS